MDPGSQDKKVADTVAVRPPPGSRPSHPGPGGHETPAGVVNRSRWGWGSRRVFGWSRSSCNRTTRTGRAGGDSSRSRPLAPLGRERQVIPPVTVCEVPPPHPCTLPRGTRCWTDPGRYRQGFCFPGVPSDPGPSPRADRVANRIQGEVTSGFWIVWSEFHRTLELCP